MGGYSSTGHNIFAEKSDQLIIIGSPSVLCLVQSLNNVDL